MKWKKLDFSLRFKYLAMQWLGKQFALQQEIYCDNKLQAKFVNGTYLHTLYELMKWGT